MLVKKHLILCATFSVNGQWRCCRGGVRNLLESLLVANFLSKNAHFGEILLQNWNFEHLSEIRSCVWDICRKCAMSIRKLQLFTPLTFSTLIAAVSGRIATLSCCLVLTLLQTVQENLLQMQFRVSPSAFFQGKMIMRGQVTVAYM